MVAARVSIARLASARSMHSTRSASDDFFDPAALAAERMPILQRITRFWTIDTLTLVNLSLAAAIAAFLYFAVIA
jgi:hypothetical protein